MVVLVVGWGVGGGVAGWEGGNHKFTKECSSCPIVDLYGLINLFCLCPQANYEFKYIEIGLF